MDLNEKIILFLKEIVTYSTVEEISTNLKTENRKVRKSIKKLLKDKLIKLDTRRLGRKREKNYSIV